MLDVMKRKYSPGNKKRRNLNKIKNKKKERNYFNTWEEHSKYIQEYLQNLSKMVLLKINF